MCTDRDVKAMVQHYQEKLKYLPFFNLCLLNPDWNIDTLLLLDNLLYFGWLNLFDIVGWYESLLSILTSAVKNGSIILYEKQRKFRMQFKIIITYFTAHQSLLDLETK